MMIRMKQQMVLLCFMLMGVFTFGQIIIDVNELKEPDPKLMDDILQRKKAHEQMGFINLNEYGINVFAPNLVEAIRFHLRGSTARIEGEKVILRQTMSIQNFRDFPLWVVDGVIFEQQPQINFNTIRKVRVLKSVAETNRYGALGNAGVIELYTNQ